MTRFVYKIYVKPDKKGELIRLLAGKNEEIIEFCFYKKKKEPRPLVCIIKLRNQSKTTALRFIPQHILTKTAYAPKYRVPDMRKKYKEREDYGYYKCNEDKDTRTTNSLNYYIKRQMHVNKTKLSHLTATAFVNGDTQMLCNLLSNWTQYVDFSRCLDALEKGDAESCNNHFYALILIMCSR